MNKTLLLLLLSAMLMHAQWAYGQQNVRIIGKVVGPNDWSLSNAHVVDVLLGEGVTTDNYGVFHINIADTGTVLRVSHVGYHPLLTSITPDMIAAKEAGVLKLTLRMTRQSTLLDMVDVPAQDHSVLIRKRGTVIHDFSFMDDNMLLLLADNGVRKLVLMSPDLQRLAEMPIRVLYLFVLPIQFCAIQQQRSYLRMIISVVERYVARDESVWEQAAGSRFAGQLLGKLLQHPMEFSERE